MKKSLSLLIVMCLLIMAGFQQAPNPTNTTSKNEVNKIGIRGTIKNINAGKDGAIILVEGKLQKDTLYDKASVLVNIHTIIQKDDLKRLYSISDLNVGDLIEVVLADNVAMSYPVQGGAKSIKIIQQYVPNIKANALTVAYYSLTKEQKKTVIKWKEAAVEEFTAPDNFTVSYKNAMKNIKGQKTFQVTFKASNEELLGPIVVYINSKSLAVLGYGLRR